MRHPDWPARLQAELVAASLAGWHWRGATCLDLLAASAEAITGRPVRAAALRLAGGAVPRGRVAALRAVQRLGGIEAAVAHAAADMGFPEIDPAHTAIGDWGVAQAGDDPRQAEGLVRGQDTWWWRLPGRGLVSSMPAEGVVLRRAWAVC